MLELFQKGGITMYPILALSIVSLAVFIERIIVLRKNIYIPKVFFEKLILLLKKRSLDEAKELCKDEKSSLGIISNVILNNIDLPISRLLDATEETGRIEESKLTKYQQTLQTIIAIAPLLGLLGTVFGMITIFDVIALKGAGDAQELSGGIAEALITTAAGLIVAIPTQLFYHIIKAKSDNITIELEVASSDIINMLLKEDCHEIPKTTQ